MTDFLDQLEDELRVAAERRGKPRRRPPTGPLKALVALAVVALVAAGGARLANRDGSEQTAAPSPSPGPTPPSHDVAYATAGDPALLNLLSARLRGFYWTEIPDGPNTADPSLGSVVLYRPEAEEPARFIAYTGKFDAVRLLTEADEERIHFDVSATNVVVVYGREREQRMLADPDVCARVGGALKLCVDRSDELRYSVFVLGDRPLAVEPLTERGWWSWAAVSPDGRSIIAQWSGYECAGHRAALIVDGRPRALTDGPSEARGWTTDGRAIVSARKDCGTPGASLVSPDGEREPIAGSPERSLSPRSADDLR